MPKIFGVDRINVDRVTNDAHNGRMDLWQRGTSFSVPTSTTTYQADRYGFSNGQNVNVTESRITSVPTLTQPLKYALRIQPNATDSVNSGNFSSIQYSVEGNDLVKYRNQSMFVSFYVRSTLTGTWAVAARSSTSDRGYLATYTTNAANTWEWKTIEIPMQSVVGGTFNLDNTAGLYLWWAISGGTTFQGAPNTWLTGNFAAVAGMPNFYGSTANTFDLTGVVISDQRPTFAEYQMMLNSVSYQEEVERCMRYCQKSYDMAVNPGTATALSGAYKLQWNYPTNPWMYVTLPKRMVKPPNVTFYNPNSGASGQGEIIGSGTFTFANLQSGEANISFNLTGVNNADFIRWHSLYEAEL